MIWNFIPLGILYLQGLSIIFKSMYLIETSALKKVYKSGKEDITVLKMVDITIERGDFVAVVGPSGSGKTTLLNLIGCIDTPTEGRILFEGVDIANLTEKERVELRRDKIGFIFQSFNLFQALTVYENIEFPLLFTDISFDDRKKRVMAMLGELGLTAFARHRVTDISGGQQQRCAIGRALIKDPTIVLADEPTGNLDIDTSKRILEQMMELNKKKGVTFLFSTHDPMVMDFANKTYKLRL